MKVTNLLILSFSLLSTSAFAQNEEPKLEAEQVEEQANSNEQAAANIPSWQQSFLNLPKETREEFVKLTARGRQLLAQKRTFEAIEELENAKRIFADSPDVENLLGSCAVEFRSFDKALAHFKRAKELSENNLIIDFNIAEIYFVSKQWKKAEVLFAELLAALGDDESSVTIQRLLEFKRLLCLIKLDRMEEAKKLAQKYDYLDDSLFPYYAPAAISFAENDPIQAELQMNRGNRIFQEPTMIHAWRDALQEFGYIASYYGDEVNYSEIPTQSGIDDLPAGGTIAPSLPQSSESSLPSGGNQ